jgi:hypothetical protein
MVLSTFREPDSLRGAPSDRALGEKLGFRAEKNAAFRN